MYNVAYSLPLNQYLSYSSPKRREGAFSEPVCILNTPRVLLDPLHALFPTPHCGSYHLWIPIRRQMEWGKGLLSMIENYKYDWVNLIHVFFFNKTCACGADRLSKYSIRYWQETIMMDICHYIFVKTCRMSRVSLVAQMVKNLPAMWDTLVWSLVRKIP